MSKYKLIEEQLIPVLADIVSTYLTGDLPYWKEQFSDTLMMIDEFGRVPKFLKNIWDKMHWLGAGAWRGYCSSCDDPNYYRDREEITESDIENAENEIEEIKAIRKLKKSRKFKITKKIEDINLIECDNIYNVLAIDT